MPGRGGGFCVQSRLRHVTRPSGRETMGMESQGTIAPCVCVCVCVCVCAHAHLGGWAQLAQGFVPI